MNTQPPPSKQQRLWQRGERHAARQEWTHAAACFESIVAGDSGHVPALLMAADSLLQLDCYRRARQCALAAYQHRARYPALAAGIAHRLRRFHELPLLFDLARNADAGVAGNACETLTELASLVSSAGEQSLARSLIDRAVAADPDNAGAHYLRGVIAMFEGGQRQAEDELERCLRIAPAFAQAHWVLSRLREWGLEDHHVQRLQRNLAATSSGSSAEAYLAFALHNELHDLGRHEQAWQALVRGCAAKRGSSPHDAPQTAKMFSLLESLCTSRFVEPVSRSDDYTPIFIVGMHRTGSSLLERILGGYSAAAAGGESYAFTAQLDMASDHLCAGALDAATIERVRDADFDAIGAGFIDASRWRTQGKPFLTEKLPHNFLNVGFIARAIPGAKILHMTRGPVDTCFSNLRTYFTHAAAYSFDQLQLADYYAQYRNLMRHWHAVMPDRMLDVSYEALVADPEATARRVFAFCGLPFEPQALQVERTPGTVATASSAQVRQGILTDRGAAWKPYEAQLQPLLLRLAELGIDASAHAH